MKYAVIESGGKQYFAREGEALEVDRLPLAAGQAVHFDDVLMAADGDVIVVGSPHVDGAKVAATVEAEIRGPKVLVFRYTPKKRFRKRFGHRSIMTRLHIDAVTVPGGRGDSEPAPEKPAASKRQAPAAKKAAAPKAAKPKAARPAPRSTAKKPPAKPGKK